MKTFLKIVIILLFGVVLALVLNSVVQSQFSMDMRGGGTSSGFAWLLKIRAAENGGQIAPSFEELGLTSGAQGMGGFPSSFPGAPGSLHAQSSLTRGLDLSKAPQVALKDLGHLALGIAAAMVIELILTLLLRARRKPRPVLT